jgi:hypothetical protein
MPKNGIIWMGWTDCTNSIKIKGKTKKKRHNKDKKTREKKNKKKKDGWMDTLGILLA